MMDTAEQQARDMLERMGVENAQEFTSGDLTELANLIAFSPGFKAARVIRRADNSDWPAKAMRELDEMLEQPTGSRSDGSTASYYELPPWARELADLIRYKRMNGSQAEMFRALYRGSEASHSDEKRQAKKLLAYAVDEVVRTHFPEESFAQYRNDVFEAIFGTEEQK